MVQLLSIMATWCIELNLHEHNTSAQHLYKENHLYLIIRIMIIRGRPLPSLSTVCWQLVGRGGEDKEGDHHQYLHYKQENSGETS